MGQPIHKLVRPTSFAVETHPSMQDKQKGQDVKESKKEEKLHLLENRKID